MTELSKPEQSAETEPAGFDSLPPKPVVKGGEWGDWPYLLIYSKHASIGWERRRDKRGGPCYLVGRESLGGRAKILERFPFTDEGWAQAWRFLLRTDETLAEQLTAKLVARRDAELAAAEIERLDASSLESVENVIFLGGHAGDLGLASGQRYDLRFRAEDLLITEYRKTQPVLVALFGELQAIEVGGPGAVRAYSMGQQIGLEMALGELGDVIGRAATKIETVIRVQAPNYEIFFQCSTMLPDALRVRLSRPLAAIRNADAAKAAPASAVAAVSELPRLASLLEAGLLTREEFERLKAQLLAGS
jgi:hypothetical protein